MSSHYTDVAFSADRQPSHHDNSNVNTSTSQQQHQPADSLTGDETEKCTAEQDREAGGEG